MQYPPDDVDIVDMTSSLDDLVPSLRNVVARPGTFSTYFPETTDDDLLLVLLDGLAEAQMVGLLTKLTATEDGELSQDAPPAATSVVLLFAGARLVQAELFNRVTSRRYKAGSAEFEEVQATNILRDILKSLETRKTTVIASLVNSDEAGAEFYMGDNYGVNAFGLDRYRDPLQGW